MEEISIAEIRRTSLNIHMIIRHPTYLAEQRGHFGSYTKRFSYFIDTGRRCETLINVGDLENIPSCMTFRNDENSSIEIIVYDIPSPFKPSYMIFNDDGIITEASWSYYSDGNMNFVHDISRDINEWLNERNIWLRPDNHEIPDEYRAEFKLRFQ